MYFYFTERRTELTLYLLCELDLYPAGDPDASCLDGHFCHPSIARANIGVSNEVNRQREGGILKRQFLKKKRKDSFTGRHDRLNLPSFLFLSSRYVFSLCLFMFQGWERKLCRQGEAQLLLHSDGLEVNQSSFFFQQETSSPDPTHARSWSNIVLECYLWTQHQTFFPVSATVEMTFLFLRHIGKCLCCV